MADIVSFLSGTDDSAVDELLFQVKDLCVLEQVSAINCSAFTHSDLPSDLESRFRNLKSLAVSKPKSTAFDSSSSFSHSKNHLDRNGETGAEFESMSDEDAAIFSPSELNSDEKGGSKSKSGSNAVSSSVVSPGFSTEKRKVMQLKQNSNRNRARKKTSPCANNSSPSLSSSSSPENNESSSVSKSKEHAKKSFVASLSNSSNSSTTSPSPPRKHGCLWFSPKKSSQKWSNKKETLSGFSWDKNKDECLSEIDFFSTKNQRKILKKAIKEEQKISREAERIIKIAKQESARMSSSAIEDEPIDSEITK